MVRKTFCATVSVGTRLNSWNTMPMPAAWASCDRGEVDLAPVDADRAGVLAVDALQDLHQRRLAGAVAAGQRVHLARRDARSRPRAGPTLLSKALLDAAHLHRGRHRSRRLAVAAARQSVIGWLILDLNELDEVLGRVLVVDLLPGLEDVVVRDRQRAQRDVGRCLLAEQRATAPSLASVTPWSNGRCAPSPTTSSPLARAMATFLPEVLGRDPRSPRPRREPRP